jgi:hypothetical protein
MCICTLKYVYKCIFKKSRAQLYEEWVNGRVEASVEVEIEIHIYIHKYIYTDKYIYINTHKYTISVI